MASCEHLRLASADECLRKMYIGEISRSGRVWRDIMAPSCGGALGHAGRCSYNRLASILTIGAIPATNPPAIY